MSTKEIEEMLKLKTRTIEEEPLLVLEGRSPYENCGIGEYECINLYSHMLRTAEIGAEWIASGYGRDSNKEIATLIYKDDDGVAIKLKTITVADFPNAEEEEIILLLWITLGK